MTQLLRLFFLPVLRNSSLGLLLLGASLQPLSLTAAPSTARVELANSVKAVAPDTISALSTSEIDQPIEFMISLKMRNYDDLKSRIERGETVPAAEMAAKYYPLASDYQSIVDWLRSEGFTITKTASNHLAVFASGSIKQVQQSLRVQFAHVKTEQGDFSSAVSAPSLPAALAAPVLGINGLQPQIKLHKHSRMVKPNASRIQGQPSPLAAGTNAPPFLVSEIAKAYNANSLSFDGTGEKIAIVIDSFPLQSDLTAFWSANSIPQSLSNVEFIDAVTGTEDPRAGEETLDAEWTSSIASGAKIRIYGTKTLAFANVDKAFQAILDDVPTQPEMHEVSISLGLGEGDIDPGQLQTDQQYFAAMAAAGLSVLVSSGDDGSKNGGVTQVSYFASDPSVTAVGGTSLILSDCTGFITDESAWNGSGGGVSTVFARPSWQVGATVPAGPQRLVPDVASAADPETGALIIMDGTEFQIGGTSWSAPVWAGFTAIINQARKAVNLPPAGLLGPKLYPLLGTAAFQDITEGDNGDYSAGVGFDLVTGLGTPNVATLIQPLTGGATPPVVTVPPASSAQLANPDPVCPLQGAQVTFSWSKGTATAYWLMVGRTQGASDIYSSGQTGGRSVTVNNLPTDGSDVWVRLWSFVGGSWVNPPQDYRFEAEPAGVRPPIIAPASGNYKKKVVVNMASPSKGATIYYTTNGSVPTAASSVFTKPFTLKSTATVMAIAVMPGVPDSTVTTARFTISKK